MVTLHSIRTVMKKETHTGSCICCGFLFIYFIYFCLRTCAPFFPSRILSLQVSLIFFHLSFHFYVHERHLFAFSSFSSPMCISVHHIHAVPLEGVRSLGTIATDGCELGRGCPESNHIQLNSGHL